MIICPTVTLSFNCLLNTAQSHQTGEPQEELAKSDWLLGLSRGRGDGGGEGGLS